MYVLSVDEFSRGFFFKLFLIYCLNCVFLWRFSGLHKFHSGFEFPVLSTWIWINWNVCFVWFSSWNFTYQIQLKFERAFNRCSFTETMPFVASFGLIKVDSWGGSHVQCLSWLRFKHLYTNIVMEKQYFPSLMYSFNKTLYMAFVNLEKAFHHVPWHVIWWALRQLGIEEWLVLHIQSLYENARSRVCFGYNLGQVLSVKVGVLQGFCLNPPFCFISGLEALTKEFHTGCPWENLY